ncbi:hypothetical protein V8C86DRAFT_1476124 [Haematococcus lacustris]
MCIYVPMLPLLPVLLLLLLCPMATTPQAATLLLVAAIMWRAFFFSPLHPHPPVMSHPMAVTLQSPLLLGALTMGDTPHPDMCQHESRHVACGGMVQRLIFFFHVVQLARP